MCLAGAASVPRMDRSWKKYQDSHSGFCFSYPKRWVHEEAAEGSGVYFESGSKKGALPQGEIDVAVLPDQSSHGEDYVQLHLAGLQKFERAQKLELLASGAIKVGGMKGVFSRNRYFDPLEKSLWVDELVVAGHGTTLYKLELECRADQLQRFEAVFDRFLNSFSPDCNQTAPAGRPEH